MSGQMEHITKMALAEMIQNNSRQSKFGLILTDDGYRCLIDTLYEFFETSRSLKSAGDRMMSQGVNSPRMPSARVPR